MKRYLLILSLLFFVCSCNDDEVCRCCEDTINGKWEAIEFMSVDSQSFPKMNNYNPVLEFNFNGDLELKLDINSCFGQYSLKENNGINFSGIGCTEACCDSEFSSKLVEKLVQVNQYTRCGDELQLHVPEWGWIKLLRLD